MGHSFDVLAKIKEVTDKYDPTFFGKLKMEDWMEAELCVKNEQRKT